MYLERIRLQNFIGTNPRPLKLYDRFMRTCFRAVEEFPEKERDTKSVWKCYRWRPNSIGQTVPQTHP